MGNTRSTPILSVAVLACAHILSLATAANATVFQWYGGGANTDWNTAANWVGSVPSNSDQTDLEFGTVALQSPGQTTANNNISSDFNLNSMTFGSTAGASFTITGSSLDWKKDGTSNPSIVQNSSFNHAINVATKVSGDSLTMTGNGSGLATIGGNITTGGKPLIKTGTSSYVLTATLSDNHTLTINNGTFALAAGANINASNIQFTGGVLAMSNSFTRALGTGSGQVRWGAGGGGFAAYGGALSVDIGSSTSQTWGGSNFVPAGSPLIFGSVIADNIVTYIDEINFGTGTAATREIRVDDNPNSSADSARITGRLTAGGGAKSLNKTGGGILELTNGTNNYGGSTTVSAGVLKANNTSGSATGTGAVTINSGGTLAGTGTVSGTVTVNAGGTVAPGNSIGTLAVGGLTLASSSAALEIELNSSATPAADLLNVTGGIILGGGVLKLSFLNTPSSFDVQKIFLIIANDLADAVSGTFGTITGVPIGYSAVVNYAYAGTDSLGRTGTGNDIAVIVSVVPEANAIAMWGLILTIIGCGVTYRKMTVRMGKLHLQ